jgi:hypothetical protein
MKNYGDKVKSHEKAVESLFDRRFDRETPLLNVNRKQGHEYRK